jgi:CRP/FNR family transcriptional regulator, anaerobic regulatory protein
LAQVSIPACGACPVREAGVCGAGGGAGRRALSRVGASVRLSPRECLFEQDDGAEHVFVVASGALTLHHTRPDGERTVLGFAGPGDLLGLDGERRLAAAEATSRVRACRFPAEGFRAAAAEHAAVGRRALDAVAADLAKARERMLLVARRGATRKTAAFVLACAERHAGPGPLPLPTRTDMASYLGLRIESVSRALAALRRAGAVAVVYRAVFLRDRAALVRLGRNGGARPGGRSAACGSRDAAAGGAATPG